MKKSFRFLAFCLASIFALFPLSANAAITEVICPSHPDSVSFIYESYNDQIHKVFCGYCDELLGYEDCYWVNPYECTDIPYCMWCDNTRSPVATSHSPLRWIPSNATYHESECKHTTIYGNQCTARLVEKHNFVGGICTECDYNSN